MDHKKSKERLAKLLDEAKSIFFDEFIKESPAEAKKAEIEKSSDRATISTPQRYQIWYSRALPLMRHLGSDRYEEFVSLYTPDPKRKAATWLHYRLQDYVRGTTHSAFDPFQAFASLMQQQIMIVQAVFETADDRLADIEVVIRADIFGHELDAAK